ncbi:MAG: hypothetical protein BIFFINMI_00531 [Phycisphaerae bacterium]|nr:hypothetical protein [Phycisphaerae bacterium]
MLSAFTISAMIAAATPAPPEPVSEVARVMRYVQWGVLLLLGGGVLWVGWRDMARLSLSRIWAISVHTLRESVRQRVLLLIPAVMLLIVLFGLFQRGFDEVSSLRQATETCIVSSSVLTLVLMLLLTAFAFPREIESRTIYSLVTKPVSRLEIFGGKVIGLSMVAAIVLGLMGLFSYGYLHVRAAQLLGAARERLAAQESAASAHAQAERDLIRYERSRVSGSLAEGPSPTTRPADTRTPTFEPSDESLAQLVHMGLLVSMNYIDVSRPMALAPGLPPDLPRSLADDKAWQWGITRRAYVAHYVLNMPPQNARGARWRLRIRMAWPGHRGSDPLAVSVRLFTRDFSQPQQVPWRAAPEGLIRIGWKINQGEELRANLRPIAEDSDIYASDELVLSGQFLEALGDVSQLAIGIMPIGSAEGQLFGARPDGLAVDLLAPGSDAAVATLNPVEFRLLPQVFYQNIFPIQGSKAGQTAENAVFHFSGLDAADLAAGDLVFQIDLQRIDKGSGAAYLSNALVTVINPGTGKMLTNPVTGRPEPLRVFPSSEHASYLHVPRDFASGGELVLEIRPANAGDIFRMGSRSVRLLGAPSSFAFNLLKSMAICLIQSVVVVAIGVMASVFLSWPVALLLNAVVLIAGNLLDFVSGIARHQTPVFNVSDADQRSVQLLQQAANRFVEESARVVTTIMPDYGRFQPVAHIGQGVSIPGVDLLWNLLWALAYIGPAIAIGYLCLHYKEVAR